MVSFRESTSGAGHLDEQIECVIKNIACLASIIEAQICDWLLICDSSLMTPLHQYLRLFCSVLARIGRVLLAL
jgi:hypothetical protein